MFKSATAFSLADLDLDVLKAEIGKLQFTPCGAISTLSFGFEPVRDQPYYFNGKQMLLSFVIEKKSIPGAALKRKVEEACARAEQAQGFAPGKKMRKEIKERVVDELLPSILPVRKSVGVWVDLANQRAVVDSVSNGVLDILLPELFKLTIEARDLPSETSPQDWMTKIVREDYCDSFTIDEYAQLVLPGDKGTVVTYQNADLTCGEIIDQLTVGKMQVCKLALTLNDEVSFVLNSSFQLSKIEALEKPEKVAGVDQFEADFLLMTGTLTSMLDTLIEEMKGEEE